MEIEDIAGLTPSLPTASIPVSAKVSWSNPNARNSAKLIRREKRNMQKLKGKKRETSRQPQDQPYDNFHDATDTTSSPFTIPDITVTSASPDKPSPLAPITALKPDLHHLQPPTFFPSRKRRGPRLPRSLRAKANLHHSSKRGLTLAEAQHRSSRFERLHKQISHHESNVKKIEEDVSIHVAHDEIEKEGYQWENLAKARAIVMSDRTALKNVWYARHKRPMTDKEKEQSERLVGLHQMMYLLQRTPKGRWRAKQMDPEAARGIWSEQHPAYHTSKNAIEDEIAQLKKELGFDVEDCELPDDPVNGVFSTKMLEDDESRWSREEKLACARHFAAAWEVELRVWEGRVSVSGALDQEVVRQSISKAYINLEHFRGKVDEFSDSRGAGEEEMGGREVAMEEEMATSVETNEGMDEHLQIVDAVDKMDGVMQNPADVGEGVTQDLQIIGREDMVEEQLQNKPAMDGEIKKLVERVERL